jgi:predicted dehydrogenase
LGSHLVLSQNVPVMPSHAPVRLGILGAGNVLSGYRGMLDQLRQRRLISLTALCGREPQRANASDLLGEVPFVTDPARILHGDDVDLVLILTSMPTHAALARTALEAGKHVVVEKPVATELPEALALARLARERNRLLLAAPFTPLSPTFQTLARRIQNGDIGKVCSARARYGWSGPWWNEWFYRPGGGCLFDLGVYCLTTLTGLIGPARRVMALTGIAIPEREINGRRITVQAEDNAQVLLDFGHGASGVVTTGFTLQQYRCPAVEIYGTEGTIQMLGDDWDPDGYELWQNSVGAWQLFKETAPDWPWTDGLREAVESLVHGTPPRLSLDHAIHVLEVILAARQSSAEGRAIELTTRFDPLPLGAHRTAHSEPAHLQHDRTR